MIYPKLYIGPMSKNVVDVILDYCKDNKNIIGIIPSRRQVDYDHGYVNNFTTKTLSSYVNDLTIIERDHGGPNQGDVEDDGIYSFANDAKWFNIVHIDPWKKYKEYNDGLYQTVRYINFIYELNNNTEFEIGTEQSLRYFSVYELDRFIFDVKKLLNEKVFKQIKYCVIQSGTSLRYNTNTGLYDKDRLSRMVDVCKKYNLMSKEHNGDYVPNDIMKEKYSLGLDAINIAPEFGYIETKVILNSLQNDHDFEKIYEICFNSRRWEKWVTKDFIPENNKEKLIEICCHYIFSNIEFLEIKNSIKNIDDKIKLAIKEKIEGVLW